MKDKTLNLELGSAVIKAISIGTSAESAMNYVSTNKLKGVKLYPRVSSDINAQINDADLLFLIFDEKDINDFSTLIRIAKISQELNILTIVLTRTEQNNVIDELKGIVDSFIVLPENSTVIFNKHIFDAMQSITESIQQQGLIGFDFADLKALTKRAGRCAIGSGVASGSQREIKAMEGAMASPLLKGINFKSLHGILINISAIAIDMPEFNNIVEPIDELLSDNTITKVAVTIDEELSDEIKVTLFCTGIDKNN